MQPWRRRGGAGAVLAAHKKAECARGRSATVNGALDTGALANNTWYYWYAIRRSDTGVTDILASASPPSSAGAYAGANMPAGYDSSRFIGATLTGTPLNNPVYPFTMSL